MVEQFNYPTTILHGAGALAELARRLSGLVEGKKFLLVTDPGVKSAGIALRAEDAFGKEGLGVETFDGVHGNPLEADVTAGVEALRRGGFRAMVALGGGSPMDVAKAI